MNQRSAAPSISFEFFPPKTEEQAITLEETVARLTPLRPHFISVTYGAGGTSQDRSFATAARMQARGLPTAAHITCAGASKQSVLRAIQTFRETGIERFVAIRGDPPGGLSESYRAHPDGFRDTADLVRASRDAGAREISVSAYPERHPQSSDWACEMGALKRKVDAGAVRAITQFFFDNDCFDAYRERLHRAGINVPIVPGIMPIYRFASVRGFADRCGASIPQDLARRFESVEPDSEAHMQVATTLVVEQITDLLRRGVEAFHIYTLNRSELAEAICRSCGILPDGERVAA